MWRVGANMHTQPHIPHTHTHLKPTVLWADATAKTMLVFGVRGVSGDKPWLQTDGTLAG